MYDVWIFWSRPLPLDHEKFTQSILFIDTTVILRSIFALQIKLKLSSLKFSELLRALCIFVGKIMIVSYNLCTLLSSRNCIHFRKLKTIYIRFVTKDFFCYKLCTKDEMGQSFFLPSRLFRYHYFFFFYTICEPFI